MRKSLFVFVLAVLVSSMAFAAPSGGGGSSFPVSCAISPSSLSAKAGTTAPVSVSCSDMNGNAVDCPPMQWSSTIGGFPPVPSTAPNIQPHTLQTNEFSAGTVAGSGSITAQSPPLSQPTFNCQSGVTVNPADAAKIAISPASATLAIGGVQKFSATLLDQYGNPIVPKQANPFSFATTGGIGKVDSSGLFTASTAGSGQVTAAFYGTPSLQGLRASADVQVVAGQQPTKFCTLDPSAATVSAGQKQTFTATCYSDDPRKMGPANTEIPCPAMLWSATDGKIDGGPSLSHMTAVFTAPASAGTVTITGYEDTPFASPTAGMLCTATAEIISGSASEVKISPTSASLLVGDMQQFSAQVLDQYGNPIISVGTSPQLLWSTAGGIGKVDPSGIFSATAAGSGTVRVEFVCPAASLNGCPHDSADVSVSKASSGSSGNGNNGGGSGSGSENGGGSFASSSTVSYTCAGKIGALSVQIFRTGATALAEVYFLGALNHPKVLSVNAANNQQMPFTPDKAGNYELRVTVGTDQRNAGFSVSACSPQNENATNDVTIQLQQPPNPEPKPSPKNADVTQTTIAPPAQQQGGIPLYMLVIGAALVLAVAYFLLFSKKK